MGYASYLVFEQGGFSKQAVPLGIYITQLLLNFLWTPLFFVLHRFDLATFDMLGAPPPSMGLALRRPMGPPRTEAGRVFCGPNPGGRSAGALSARPAPARPRPTLAAPAALARRSAKTDAQPCGASSSRPSPPSTP
jgi:hypothetical protein